jgi:hypothetical protein
VPDSWHCCRILTDTNRNKALAGFVAWLTGFRVRRVAFIAGLYLLPLTSVLSAAIVVLTAELKGTPEALKDIGLALVGLLFMAFLSGGDPLPLSFLISAVVSWSIAAVLGGVNYRYRSFTLVVQLALLIVLGAMFLFSLVVVDTAAFWQQVIYKMIADLPSDLMNELTAEFSAQGIDLDQVVSLVSQIMTPVVASVFLLSSLVALVIGSVWACAVRNENFLDSYRTLKLGYVLGGFAAAVGIASLLGFPIASGILMIVSIAFLLQGIAVLSCWAQHQGWPNAWWVAVILPLIFMPVMPIPSAFMGFGLAGLGFIDNWYTLRPKTA